MHPELKAEVMEAFEKFFDSNWYVLGKEVKAFEEEYARYSDVDHCIGVANGFRRTAYCPEGSERFCGR
jgi:dTDP-4-amino-4,6-dideoxygalactose transaminase